GRGAGATRAGAARDTAGHTRPRPPRTPLANDTGCAAAGRPGLRGPRSRAHLRPRLHAVRTAPGGPVTLPGPLGVVDVLPVTPRPWERAGAGRGALHAGTGSSPDPAGPRGAGGHVPPSR